MGPRGRSTSWSRWRLRWRAVPHQERSHRKTGGTRSSGCLLSGSSWTYMSADSTDTPSDKHRGIKAYLPDMAKLWSECQQGRLEHAANRLKCKWVGHDVIINASWCCKSLRRVLLNCVTTAEFRSRLITACSEETDRALVLNEYCKYTVFFQNNNLSTGEHIIRKQTCDQRVKCVNTCKPLGGRIRETHLCLRQVILMQKC